MMQKLKRNWLVNSKLTWGIWQILIRHSKISKFALLTKVYNVWAKKIEELFLMVLNTDAKFEEKITSAFKNDMKNLANFHQSTFESQKIGTLMGSFIQSRKCMSLNLQRSFVLWQRRRIENLKSNWLVSSKLTWGIWQILTWALKNLKNLHFNGLLLNKVYNVWAKKSIGEFCLMALNIDATFEGKLTCAFKNDMRNLANFHQSMFGSLKIGTLMGPFCSK